MTADQTVSVLDGFRLEADWTPWMVDRLKVIRTAVQHEQSGNVSSCNILEAQSGFLLSLELMTGSLQERSDAFSAREG